jgi:hypothetical protein
MNSGFYYELVVSQIWIRKTNSKNFKHTLEKFRIDSHRFNNPGGAKNRAALKSWLDPESKSRILIGFEGNARSRMACAGNSANRKIKGTFHGMGFA